jgi:dynein heavy chain
MFSQVDRSWKDTMKAAQNLMRSNLGLYPDCGTMQQNNALLEQIQKCLEDY